MAIAHKEGITYEHFRSMGGAEVIPPSPFPCSLSLVFFIFKCQLHSNSVFFPVTQTDSLPQSGPSVYARIDNFWKTEIKPLRKTDFTVLIVSHGGIISTLRHYLRSMNYRIHDSLLKNGELRDKEVRNCSITEIVLAEKGPGEFIRMGDWDHIMASFTQLYEDRLEDSTGNVDSGKG